MSAVLRLVDAVAGSGDGELPPIARFEIWMQGRGLSKRTIVDTMFTLRRLERQADRPVQSVSALVISQFLGAPQLGPSARYTYHVQLRGFYRWYADNDGGTDPMVHIPRPRMPRREPRPITTEQLQALLRVRKRRKTQVMVLLGALAGLRVHEIAKVRGQDVDLDSRTLYVVGKGGHGASIPLHPLIVEAAASMPRRGWWFPANNTRPGQHVRSRNVGDVIADAMRRAGIHDGTAHRLRHWYGSKLVADGTDLRTAQTLLRHQNLQTTAIYVQVVDVKRVEAIDRLNPFEIGD